MMEAYWIWWHAVTRHMIRTYDGAYEYYYSVWNDEYVGCVVLKEAIFAINTI